MRRWFVYQADTKVRLGVSRRRSINPSTTSHLPSAKPLPLLLTSVFTLYPALRPPGFSHPLSFAAARSVLRRIAYLFFIVFELSTSYTLLPPAVCAGVLFGR